MHVGVGARGAGQRQLYMVVACVQEYGVVASMACADMCVL
jgi:hypothetical protein